MVVAWIGCLAALPAAGDSVRREDGRRLMGTVQGSAATGFRFVPEGGGAPQPLEALRLVELNGPGPAPATAARPPFTVVLAGDQRISGQLGLLDETVVRLASGPAGQTVTLQRRGVQALVQRPGEVLVLAEPFDRLDRDRWVVTGAAAVPAEAQPGGARGLRLPASGGSVAWQAGEPIAAGRLEAVYHDDGRRAPGRRLVLELLFRGGGGVEPVQAVLGWTSEVLAVVTRGEGPALAVQRLVRQPGRHRLGLSFGPDGIDLSLDGAELAHGDPAPGPLVGLRLVAEGDGPDVPEGLAATVEELQIARRTAPPSQVEVDPTQDEARLVQGDQLFGRVLAADRDGLTARIAERRVALHWSEVAGLHFRRAASAAEPIDGLWVRLAWRAGAGTDPPDVLEGALRRIDETAAVLEVPYLGELTLPRPALTELRMLGPMSRTVLDPFPRHLGNKTVPGLDPPQPEGRSLEIAFDLDARPPGRAAIGVSVLQVVGIEGDPDYSERVRHGELLTRVALNGQTFDTLNRHVTVRNDTPARLQLPVPEGALKPGRNVLRFEQDGLKESPETLDNLGLWNVTLELERPTEAPTP